MTKENRVHTCEDGVTARSPEDCICDRPSNDLVSRLRDPEALDTSNKELKELLNSAADEIERLRRELVKLESDYRLQNDDRFRLVQSNGRLRKALGDVMNGQLGAGADLNAPRFQRAREALAGTPAETNSERCEHYWRMWENRCLLRKDHRGEHWYAAPQHAISVDVDFGSLPCAEAPAETDAVTPEFAARFERGLVDAAIKSVEAIAGDRTDAYWAGVSMACEEIRHRLGEAWRAIPATETEACICRPVGAGDGDTYVVNPRCRAHK